MHTSAFEYIHMECSAGMSHLLSLPHTGNHTTMSPKSKSYRAVQLSFVHARLRCLKQFCSIVWTRFHTWGPFSNFCIVWKLCAYFVTDFGDGEIDGDLSSIWK